MTDERDRVVELVILGKARPNWVMPSPLAAL
jgi:hypothetical protein